jgi:hypothetical protein
MPASRGSVLRSTTFGRRMALLAVLYSLTSHQRAFAQEQPQQSLSAPAPLIHIVRKTDNLSSQPMPNSPPAAHLNYYGGPVVSNLQVVAVFWGSGVNSTVTSQIGGFYQAVTKSSYFDLISEYSTTITPVGGGTGTNQSIGRGDYGGAFTIAPSVCATAPCTVTDAQVRAEILSQVTAGNLPAPTLDSDGNVNTLYMTYFPHGITITQGGASSCVIFCAYHGTTSNTFNSKHLLYGVMPDFGAGSGCDSGCGGGTEFQNVTSVSSHEMIETVTDADVGIATTFAPPLAWYDPNSSDKDGGGEIGDICNAEQAQVSAGGSTYTVQKEWSNFEGACVSIGAHPTFQVTAPNTSTGGTSFNFTVTAQNPVGGSTDTSFVGTAHFSSSDSKAILPADYAFTPTDKGTQTFGATLKSSGSQTITATDTVNGAIVGAATLTVNTGKQAPAITSANSTAFTEASAGTFTVTATGSPTPSLTRTGTLPNGVGFVDNGNGTARLSGTPASGSHGTYNLTFTAHNTASPDATQNFTLTVNAAALQVSISPSSVDFGDVNLNKPARKVVLVKNTGTLVLSISKIWLTQDVDNDFTFSTSCKTSLLPGKSCSVAITFSEPAQEGDRATLHIADNVPGSPQTVPIIAHATQVQVRFTPGSLAFASTVGSSQTQPVTLTNIGTSALTFNSIAIRGANASDFAQTNNCLPTLAAHAQCSVSVTFAPTATGLRTADLMVRANAGFTQQTMPVSGSGN